MTRSQAWRSVAPSLLGLISGALVLMGVVATLWLHEELSAGIGPRLERRLQQDLHNVVREGAARLDGSLVRAAVGAGDPGAPAYVDQQAVLRSVQERFGLDSDIYTLHLDQDGPLVGLTSKDAPLLGERDTLRPDMVPVFQGADAGHTGVYEDEHGWWISAYAPIRAGHDIVGIVGADVSIGPYIEESRARVMRSVVVALLLGLLVALPVVVIVSLWLVRSPGRLDRSHHAPVALRGVVSRATRVSLVVGTALNLINQGDAFLAGLSHVDLKLVALNFLVPFLVSSYSGAIATMRERS